jgi:succinylglutamic semialdehyde dehydrogenase
VANDSPFGLSASVFTSSAEAFERCADELRVGVLHWNRSSAGASGRLPFGGIKASGNHRPGGILMGVSCVYPMGVLLPPKEPTPLPSWPGLSF